MNRSTKQVITYALYGLAAVAAIALVASADQGKERYLIENPITNGGKHDQETKRRMVFPDNDYTADHRINDRVFQNRNLSAAPAGSAKSPAGHKKTSSLLSTDYTDGHR